ncbi:hypothetical protein CRENBAI_005554 [Crenichthys baileyi]|uniref:Immunoglobulin V-set domain-containing protein n=1 Tax=Crenichthys baileyi TaxID=28760 RepID=A0AAV9RDY8_9TELE
MDIDPIQTCAGGSAVLPCHTPNREGLAVEGVILSRQRGRAPVEVAYHSQQLLHSLFSTERVQLSSTPRPGDITFNVTLLQLQPEDSALYSCQLLLRGRPNRSTSLRGHIFFISVQDDRCGCSSYPTLIYALAGAGGVLLLLLILVGCVVVFKGKASQSPKSQSQAPIYEEMIGVKSPSRKLASLRLEEVESSEYKNCVVKKASPGNDYESPKRYGEESLSMLVQHGKPPSLSGLSGQYRMLGGPRLLGLSELGSRQLQKQAIFSGARFERDTKHKNEINTASTKRSPSRGVHPYRVAADDLDREDRYGELRPILANINSPTLRLGWTEVFSTERKGRPLINGGGGRFEVLTGAHWGQS